MKILDLIAEKNRLLHSSRQPVIVCFGDSITQGCFECYSENGQLQTVFESGENYGEKLKKILQILFPAAPVTIVNAGISGGRARGGLCRLQRDVLSYQPDLVIICFGLNDATAGEAGLREYVTSLRQIFMEIREKGNAEIIFMTPNLRTERVSPDLADSVVCSAAEKVAGNEDEGWLEQYICAAKELCREWNVPICDCYRIWKQFKSAGADLNRLLANKINHPLRELHWLFAYELVKTMLQEEW